MNTFKLTGLPNKPGNFTFLRSDTPEFFAASLNEVNPSELGLIEISITPEKVIDYTPEPYAKQMFGATRSGGSGLTGESVQGFVKTNNFPLDHRFTEVFVFQLVPKEIEVKPLISQNNVDLSLFDDLQIKSTHVKITSVGKSNFHIEYPELPSHLYALSTVLCDLINRKLIVLYQEFRTIDGKYLEVYRIVADIDNIEFLKRLKQSLGNQSEQLLWE
jgi:hypothetical protein